MQGGRVTVVEFVEVADVLVAGGIDQIREAPGLFLHLSVQVSEKPLHVDLAAGQGQHVGASGEVGRYGVGNGTAASAVGRFALLGKTQRCEVGAHAEAGSRKRVLASPQGMVDHRMHMFCGAAAVELRLVVHHTATGPEVPGKYIPAVGQKGFGQAEYVRSAAMTFQTVGYNRQAIAVLAVPVQVKFVVIRGREDFRLRPSNGDLPKQCVPYGLNVSVAQPDRWAVRVFDASVQILTFYSMGLTNQIK